MKQTLMRYRAILNDKELICGVDYIMKKHKFIFDKDLTKLTGTPHPKGQLILIQEWFCEDD